MWTIYLYSYQNKKKKKNAIGMLGARTKYTKYIQTQFKTFLSMMLVEACWKHYFTTYCEYCRMMIIINAEEGGDSFWLGCQETFTEGTALQQVLKIEWDLLEKRRKEHFRRWEQHEQ